MSIASLLFRKRNIEEDYLFLQRRAPIRSIPVQLTSIVERRICGNHIFLEAGQGKPVIFCHGLFGGLFNIDKVGKEVAKKYRFMMPYLPMYDMPLMDCNIPMLGDYLLRFPYLKVPMQ